MKFSRQWSMPNHETFDIPCIGGFVKNYLIKSKISIDPFSRNKTWFTYTNDLNPETAAKYHMDARDFLDMLIKEGVKSDLVICDPPYSQIQVSRAYAGIGREYKPFGDDNNAVMYRDIRTKLDALLSDNGVALSFAWNSVGFGKNRGYEIEEIMLVCHGGAHNDTICMAERKILQPKGLFE